MSTSTGRRVVSAGIAVAAAVTIAVLLWTRRIVERAPSSSPDTPQAGVPGYASSAPVPRAVKPDATAPAEQPKPEDHVDVTQVEELPTNPTPEMLFESGSRLIDSNSRDAPGRSRLQLEVGIARVERALREGFPNQRAAYRQLAFGFNGLLSRTTLTPEARIAYQRREREAYEKLATLEPDHLEWRMLHVGTLAGQDEQLSALQRVVKEHPSYSPAHAAIARILCARGDHEGGGRHLVDAARNLGADERYGQPSNLVALAYRCGGEPVAVRVRAALEQGAQ